MINPRALSAFTFAIAAVWLLSAGCPSTPSDAFDNDSSDSAQPAPGPGDQPPSAGPAAPALAALPEPVRGSQVELRWAAVAGATHYSVYAGTAEDPPFLMNVASPSFTLRNLFGCRTYYWRVESHDATGSRSSGTASFRTQCQAEAPGPPRYPAPSNHAFGVPEDVALSWNPDPKASRYEVHFGETPNPPYVGATSEPRFTRLPNVGEGREYYWHVVAVNDEGTATSRTWRFSVTETPDGPPTPVPLAPPEGGLDVPTRVLLDWADSDGALGYDVYLAADPDPQMLLARVPESELPITEELALATTYYWRVVAVGPEASTPGPVWSFVTVSEPTPPAVPRSPVPIDGVFGVDPGVELRWANDPSAASYDVYLGDDTDPLLVATVTEPRYKPGEPLAGGLTYFWRVVAHNDLGTTEGPLWRLMVAYGGGGGGGGGAPDGGAGVISRVSISSSGQQANGASLHPVISGDDRYVAFASAASNLVAGDTNGSMDVFVHDRNTGLTTRVSVDSTGGQAHGKCEYPSISADGRYVAFHTMAALVAADTNGFEDVYVHDRTTGETSLISAGGNGASKGPAISGDGQIVAFYSRASNLVPGDNNRAPDIFVRGVQGGAVERVHVASSGAEADRGAFGDASISYDGQQVAFSSAARNFGGGGGMFNVWIRDRDAGQTEFVGIGILPSMSNDGQQVAWVWVGTGGPSQVWVHDRTAGTWTTASVSSDGTVGDRTSWLPAISGSGRFVGFASIATNLVPGCTSDELDIFRHDRVSGETVLLCLGVGNQLGDADSASPNLSDDGATATFLSGATNLVLGDTNGTADVFVVECGP